MQYWWVNQNQTYKHELAGGYLWSPKANANNAKNHFYDNMTRAQPGDMIFSFCDTLIKAVGIVTDLCDAAPKPHEFGAAGSYWSQEGWLLPVTFEELPSPLHPKSHMAQIGPVLPSKYSPLQSNGNGNQGVYLAEVPEAMALVLIALVGAQLPSFTDVVLSDGHDTQDVEEEARISNDTHIPNTEKLQLIKARRGQGLFRKRVESMEKACRVTGVTFKPLLRASHIKPWCTSTNAEKLDGNNGLLLAPHIDVLFDKGYISFSNSGDLLVSSKLPPDILSKWGAKPGINVGEFGGGQRIYLDHHRAVVFLN